MKFFRPGFFQKVLISILILLQFLIIIGGIVLGTVYTFVTPWTVPIFIGVYAINTITGIIIFNSKTPDAYKLSWMLAVFALPVAGLLMYLAFANKQTRRRQKKITDNWLRPLERVTSPRETIEKLAEFEPDALPIERYLFHTKGGGIFQNTNVEYFPLVDDVFPRILESLKEAKHYIFLEVFILQFDGYFFSSIRKILKEKVKEGIDVRLIYDDLGSLKSAPIGFDATLRRDGINARAFNHFRPIIDVRQNNRDHRKLILIDGHTCYTGGFNFADEYINRRMVYGHWKDCAIKVVGEAVTSYTMMFLANWESNYGKSKYIDREYYSSGNFISEIGGYPKEAKGFVQPYCDIPFDKEAVGQRVYLQLIQRAKRYLYITTPYLIIDREIENSLITAAKSGVDVRIVTPKVPDKPTVYELTRSDYGNLLRSGVKIYEYTPGFIHTKSFLVDDTMGTIGTINLDYRSLFLHLENGTFLVGVPSLKDMKEDFRMTFAKSHEVNYAEWNSWRERKWVWWSLLRIVSPFL